MRITYLHQYFNTPEMAGGTRSYEMARRLVALGHGVHMITSWRADSNSCGWFETEEAGIRVSWIPVPYSNHMTYVQRIRAFLSFAFRSARKAASSPADVVFATSTPLTIALPGAFAARKRSVPMVFEVRDLWPELPIAMGALADPLSRYGARLLERFAYFRSARIVALSPGMKEGIVRTGYPSERVKVIPNAADLTVFDPQSNDGYEFRKKHGLSEKSILAVYTGTFGRINGVSYLAHLAAEMADDLRFQFVAIGEGQEREKVERLARKLGVLGRNMRIMDPRPKAEIADVLAAADIAMSMFIPMPEMEANSANKFFDGLASGCCMAINYGGWQADLISKHKAGIGLDPDPAIAANQLKALGSRPESIACAGLNARRLAEDKFSRDLLAAKLERVLIDVVQAGKASAR